MEMNLDHYRGLCSCGIEHSLATKEVLIEKGAAKRLPELVRSLRMPKYLVAVCDDNTKQYADEVLRLLPDCLHPLRPVIVLNSEGLHADEKAVGEVIAQLPADAGWLLAVGSGTIHDTTRYAAKEKCLPYISYPTAASVDGFLSTVCAMTWNGFKATFYGDPPVAVVADTDVFANAPYRLTASGVGDVLGKYTALADWKIASLLIGEEYCEAIAAMEQEAVDNVRKALPGIKAGDTESMEALMFALLLSGLAMQMWGNSRPASCCEHHLSHFWEMNVLPDTKSDGLHGEQVGVALCELLPIYNALAKTPDWAKRLIPYQGIPTEKLKELFGPVYPDIEASNTPDPMKDVTPEGFSKHEAKMREVLSAMPDAVKLKEEMAAANVLTELSQLGLSQSIMAKCKFYSPFIRERISLLRVCNLMTDFNL